MAENSKELEELRALVNDLQARIIVQGAALRLVWAEVGGLAHNRAAARASVASLFQAFDQVATQRDLDNKDALPLMHHAQSLASSVLKKIDEIYSARGGGPKQDPP